MMTPFNDIKVICVAAAIALAGCEGAGQKTGTYVDDSAITSKVKTEMLANSKVSGTSIGVETHKGEVMLSGFAKSAEEKAEAERVAWSAPGVTSVENRITISYS